MKVLNLHVKYNRRVHGLRVVIEASPREEKDIEHALLNKLMRKGVLTHKKRTGVIVLD